MELFKLKKGTITVEEVPDAPECLDDFGTEAWNIYCEILIEQNRLYKEYLIALTQLCWLEQKIEEARKDLDEKEFTRTIKDYSVEARQYRKAYGLTEESRPNQTEGNKNQGKSKSKKASGWDG